MTDPLRTQSIVHYWKEQDEQYEETITKQTTNVKQSCGHTSQVELDTSTRGWKQYLQTVPCLVCQPTWTVERLCGHTEEVTRRMPESPRARDSAALQLCSDCRSH